VRGPTQSAGGSLNLKSVGPLSLTAMVASYVVNFIGVFSLAPVLPAIRAAFAGTPGADILAQVVGATSGFAFALGCLVSGWIISRVGDRRVYLACLLAFALSGTAGAVAPNLMVLIATRAAVGLATAGITNAALVAVGRLLVPQSQSRALGLGAMVGSITGIIGFPVVGLLASVDWRLPFLAHLVALALYPAVLGLPKHGTAVAAADAAPARLPCPIIVVAAIFVGTLDFVGAFFGPLLLSDIGVKNPAILALPPTAAAIGATIGAALYTAYRPRFRLVTCLAGAIGFMAAGVALQGLLGAVWATVTGAAITMLGAGIFTPGLNDAAIASSPENPAPSLGLVNALLYGSMILFPLAASPLEAALGGPHGELLAYAVAAGALALFLVAGGRLRGLPTAIAHSSPAHAPAG
jgi:predicted MFS family arabinose efflux permease